ncbi:MAG: hypothetical protein AAF654_11705 [Myxococcota bacterium]
MMDLRALAKARKRASHHVQAAIRRFTGPAQLPGIAEVEVEILQSFRGPAQIGSLHRIHVPVIDQGQERPTGGWHLDHQRMKSAVYLEFFANAGESTLELAYSNILILDSPSDTPSNVWDLPGGARP